MANLYNTDQNERMERLDRISSLVGNYLLKGYKMLADECETCQTVLLEDRQNKRLCVGCDIVDKTPDNEKPSDAPSTVLIRDIPTGMSREQLYATLSEQTSARNTDVRRTPSPPPRLIQAASVAVTGQTSVQRHVKPSVSEAVNETIVALCQAIRNADHSNLLVGANIKQYAETIIMLSKAFPDSFM